MSELRLDLATRISSSAGVAHSEIRASHIRVDGAAIPVMATPLALAAGVAASGALAAAFVGGFGIGQALG